MVFKRDVLIQHRKVFSSGGIIVMCGSGNDAVWRVCCSGIVRFSNGLEMVSVIFQRVQG